MAMAGALLLPKNDKEDLCMYALNFCVVVVVR
jgi:hypothetical protein